MCHHHCECTKSLGLPLFLPILPRISANKVCEDFTSFLAISSLSSFSLPLTSFLMPALSSSALVTHWRSSAQQGIAAHCQGAACARLAAGPVLGKTWSDSEQSRACPARRTTFLRQGVLQMRGVSMASACLLLWLL